MGVTSVRQASSVTEMLWPGPMGASITIPKSWACPAHAAMALSTIRRRQQAAAAAGETAATAAAMVATAAAVA
eukprot:6927680-Prymnesium_polylepis.1